MGLLPVANDHLATIVTALEMRERPRPRPMPPSPFRLVHWPAPESDKYRALFRRVGGPWLWFSRLVMEETRLRAILDDPAVMVHAVVDRAGVELGMLELDFRTKATCELSYVGLVPEITGKGHGNWLMAQALAFACARRSSGYGCTPARSTIPLHSASIVATASCPISARSRPSPIRA